MDTTALTTAWLGAVYRTRSAAYQHFVEQVPQAKPLRADRTLSDAIESGLKDAGAKPLPTVNQVEATSNQAEAAPASDAASTQHVIDRLA
jgi:hypothetical protein